MSIRIEGCCPGCGHEEFDEIADSTWMCLGCGSQWGPLDQEENNVQGSAVTKDKELTELKRHLNDFYLLTHDILSNALCECQYILQSLYERPLLATETGVARRFHIDQITQKIKHYQYELKRLTDRQHRARPGDST